MRLKFLRDFFLLNLCLRRMSAPFSHDTRGKRELTSRYTLRFFLCVCTDFSFLDLLTPFSSPTIGGLCIFLFYFFRVLPRPRSRIAALTPRGRDLPLRMFAYGSLFFCLARSFYHLASSLSSRRGTWRRSRLLRRVWRLFGLRLRLALFVFFFAV